MDGILREALCLSLVPRNTSFWFFPPFSSHPDLKESTRIEPLRDLCPVLIAHWELLCGLRLPAFSPLHFNITVVLCCRALLHRVPNPTILLTSTPCHSTSLLEAFQRRSSATPAIVSPVPKPSNAATFFFHKFKTFNGPSLIRSSGKMIL